MRRFLFILVLLTLTTLFSLVWLTSLPRFQHWLGAEATRLIRTHTGLPIQVAWIYWNPLVGSVTIGDAVLIGDDREPWVEIPLTEIEFRWGKLQVGTIGFKSIVLHGLRARAQLAADGTLEPASTLQEQFTLELDPDTEPPIEVEVESVELRDADLRFAMAEPDMEVRFRNVDIGLGLDGLQPQNLQLEFRDGSYRLMEWDYEDIRIVGGAGFAEPGLVWRDLEVHSGQPQADLSVDGHLAFGEADPILRLDVVGQADANVVNLHYTDVPSLLGTAQLDVGMQVDARQNFTLDGSVHADVLEVQDRLVRDFATTVDLDEWGMRFQSTRFRTRGGSVELTGAIDWADPQLVELAFHNRIDGVRLDWVEAFSGTELPVQGSYAGQATVAIRVDREWFVRSAVDGTVNVERISGMPGGDMSDLNASVIGAVMIDPLWMRFGGVRVGGDWFAGVVNGSAPIAGQAGGVNVAGEVQVGDLAHLQPVVGMDLTGGADLRFEYNAPRITVRAAATDLGVVGTRWRFAEGQVVVTPELLALREIYLAASKGSAAGQVQVDLATGSYEGTAAMEGLALYDVAPRFGVTGTVAGEVRISGDGGLLIPAIAGEARVAGLAVEGLAVGDLTYSGRRAGRVLQARIGLAGPGQGTVRGFVDLQEGVASAAGTVTLAVPPGYAEAVEFDALETALRGSLRRDGYALQAWIRGATGSAATGAPAALTATVLADDAGISMVGYKRGQRWSGQWSAELPMYGPRVTAAGRLTVDDPWPLAEDLEHYGGTAAFDISTRLDDLRRVDGRLVLSDGAARFGGAEVKTDGRWRLSAAGGSLHLARPATLVANGIHRFTVAGGVDLGRSWDLSARGELPLSLLVPLEVGIEDAAGHTAFELGVRGAWDRPQLTGVGELAANRIDLSGLETPVDDVSGNLSFSGSLLRISDVSGRFGDGRVGFGGTVGLIGARFGELDLGAWVDTQRVRLNDHLTTGLDGELNLSGIVGRPILIDGDVRLHDLDYQEEIAWERTILKMRTKAVEPEMLVEEDDPRLDIHIHGSRDLEVDTNLLQGSFDLDLDVRGAPSYPRYFGTVEFTPGSLFFFRGQVYNLRRGIVQMLDATGRKPFLDIEATTTVWNEEERTEYRITLVILGPVDQLEIHFQSDPPLEEADILTLLSFGVLAEDFSQQTGGLEISSILLSSQISRLEQEIQSIIGFDRLEIEPAFNSSTGSSSMQVTLQKRIGERFSVRLSSGLDAYAEQRIELGYRVSKGLDISLGWDSESNSELGNFFTRPRLVVPIP